MTPIDINADLGEGSGNDAQIMPLISSCNIACGGHYGDETSMRTAIRLAKKHGVKIGAHPAFPDKDNFGRKVLTLTKSELTETIFNQLLSFYAVSEIEEAQIHHIKLHGALYNYAAKDAATADAVVEAIVATKIRPNLYVPAHSILARKAQNIVPLIFEAFIDRRYNDDLSLVSRDQEGAIIHAAEDAWLQLHKMATQKEVVSIAGNNTEIVASTYCIHGDHPNSVDILKYIHKQLRDHSMSLS